MLRWRGNLPLLENAGGPCYLCPRSARVRILGVIVNYRTPGLALDAARALSRQLDAYPGSGIVLVENDSPDDSATILRQGLAAAPWAASVRLVPSGRNGGFGFGNNVGIRLGLGQDPPPDLFYFLNPDAVPDPGVVDELVAAFRDRPEVGIVGSEIRSFDGRWEPGAFRFPTVQSEVESAACFFLVSRWLGGSRVALSPADGPVSVDWVTGSSMAVRREVFDAIGLFDEAFFLYFEEVDLCRRAKGAGFEVLHLPAAKVLHKQGASTGVGDHRRRMPAYWFESRWRYFQKHHGTGYALGASVGWAAGHLVRQAKETLTRRPTPVAPQLLQDFVAHTARAAWRSPTRRSARS
jgi:hypothetical protein